jgi:nucleotide-binding universal stress UspA family protein
MTALDPAGLFERPLIPVASEADARITRDAILPYLVDASSTVILVHVIKQSEGGIDPSPLDAQEEEAERLFGIATGGRDGLVIETQYAYGSNVAESILETARETDASVVAIAPRERSLFMRLLTGETTRPLMANSDVPVLSIPQAHDGDEDENEE